MGARATLGVPMAAVARHHLAELWSPEQSADGTSLPADQRAIIDALHEPWRAALTDDLAGA